GHVGEGEVVVEVDGVEVVGEVEEVEGVGGGEEWREEGGEGLGKGVEMGRLDWVEWWKRAGVEEGVG
ncbi:hypothetical protein, partial [Kocuria salsicia]|uniref:hypothetical protein n=1 Tax=Kocuria salsicia TaxID=664639 RepID=UPI001C92F099